MEVSSITSLIFTILISVQSALESRVQSCEVSATAASSAEYDRLAADVLRLQTTLQDRDKQVCQRCQSIVLQLEITLGTVLLLS